MTNSGKAHVGYNSVIFDQIRETKSTTGTTYMRGASFVEPGEYSITLNIKGIILTATLNVKPFNY